MPKNSTKKAPPAAKAPKAAKKTPPVAAVPPATAPRALPFGRLAPSPLNPRKRLDSSREALLPLAQSIAAKGVLENLLVRRLRPADAQGDALYEIIAGERRWRAVCLAVAENLLPADCEVPVALIHPCSDAELVELAGAENMGREDMEPLDEADLIAAMRVYHKDDAEIMRRLGIPERTFYRRVALLKLDDSVQAAVRDGKISLAQASAFTLGEKKVQREYLTQLLGAGGDEAIDNEYMAEPEQIRDEMLERRASFDAALFPIEYYHGEVVEDPATGERYFADRKAFAKLQAAAIRDRVAALKKQWPWIEEIKSHDAYKYRKAKKGDARGGAIYYVEDGALTVGAPVLKPADAKKDDAARQKTTTTARNDGAAQREALKLSAALAMIETPQAALAAFAARSLLQSNFDLWVGVGVGESERKRSEAQREAVRPFVAKVFGFADDADFADACAAIDEAGELRLYRALMALPLGELVAFYVALAIDYSTLAVFVDHAGAVTPLGIAFLQRELPLAAEAAQ